VSFERELEDLLPEDLPDREHVVTAGARHLDLIVEANQRFNLTRITGTREAAIKHVLDSVIPWRLFATAAHILDAGTGAGFPGIPLALALPETQFTLAESIGKKARFLESVVAELSLKNVTVAPHRAEELLLKTQPGIITARAVAPVSRAAVLFGPALKKGSRALLYKGLDVEAEIGEAEAELRKRQLRARVLLRYELPGALGTRAMVEMFRS
jgi:16S rRNA (guanine527-N7)-methyltransferase